MGLLTPARPTAPPEVARDVGGALAGRLADDPHPPRLREMLREARGTVPLAERLAHDLHPVSAFLVVPLFALANAGISLERGALAGAGAGAVLGGVVAGRVVGKLAGIAAATWLAVRLGLADRPEGASWAQLAGVATVAGSASPCRCSGRPGLPRRPLPGPGLRSGCWRRRSSPARPAPWSCGWPTGDATQGPDRATWPWEITM
jgi:hypothetical protein